MLTVYNISIGSLFKELSFSVIPGAIVYIKGIKKSGKSTLLRIISGLQKYDTGNIYLQGIEIDNIKKPYAIYINQTFDIKDNLTLLQNLLSWTKLHNSEPALAAAIHYCGLKDLLYIKCRKLNLLDKEKIIICRLLSCQSDLWLLDETESLLEKSNLELLYNCIKIKAYNGGIICITTQNNPYFKAQIINLKDFII